MQWLAAAAFIARAVPLGVPGDGVPPIGSPGESVASYLLGFGPLGLMVLVLALVLYRGVFILAKTAEKDKTDAVALARADLLAENERLLARAEKAEGQRDEAMRIAQDKLVPLATSFTVTMGAFVPLLQELVSARERGRGQ